MLDSEKMTMVFFNLETALGFLFIITGILRKSSAEELTGDITTSFLMSISGNCTRILAKPDALISEKIVISLAVLTYSTALVFDYTKYAPSAGVCLKLVTTGSVGLWNALQMKRLHATPASTRLDAMVSYAACCSYSLGAVLGYGSFLARFIINVPIEQLKPFISFAFLMSHLGNLLRTQFNSLAPFPEKSHIQIVMVFYSIALFCDFWGGNECVHSLAANTKLTAAAFVGLWNTAQTWRLNPTIYEGVEKRIQCVSQLCHQMNTAVSQVRVASLHNINRFFNGHTNSRVAAEEQPTTTLEVAVYANV